MLKFSPGIALGCIELISLSKVHKLSPRDFLTTFPNLGPIRSEPVVAAGQHLNWVIVSTSGHLAPTNRGDTLTAITDFRLVFRQMLLDYIEVVRPAWLQNAISGRARVLNFVEPEILQLFRESEVATSLDDDVVYFWDQLSCQARGQRDSTLNQIGRIGEKLSIEYEYRRTGLLPKWVAVESNLDGYDLLSTSTWEDRSPLTIEVKSSKVGISGLLHLTANEWEAAEQSSNHIFHLWDLSGKLPQLCKVLSDQLAAHIPANRGTGLWNEIRIPFLAFKNGFQTIEEA